MPVKSHVECWISNVRYKPGWSFVFVEPNQVRISGPVTQLPDDDRVGPILLKNLVTFSMKHMDCQHRVSWWLLQEAFGMELHEAFEWFTVNGKRFVDPHKVKDLKANISWQS